MSGPVTTPMRQLWSAVLDGSVDDVEKLLKDEGVLPNASNNSGLQAIHLAAKTGRVEMAQMLLKNGACVNAMSGKGNTALHTASLIGHVEMTKLLLSNQAEVNVMCDCNEDTFTPLYMAAQGGHQEIVTLLLIHGANPLSKTKNGFTAHDIATQQGHVVIAELLEEYSKQKQQNQQQLLQHETHQNQLQPQQNETQKCWEASNNTDEFLGGATKLPQQKVDMLSEQRNHRLPRLLHLLPHQRNRIRCSRSCDKMISRGELTRLHLHNDMILNKLNKGILNKGNLNKVSNNKIKAPSVSKQDFLQTPHNSPMRNKNSE